MSAMPSSPADPEKGWAALALPHQEAHEAPARRSPLQWLRRALGLLLQRRPRVETQADVPAAPASGGRKRLPQDPALARSRALLRRVLDRHPGARKVFPHLATMERALRRRGEAGLHRLPLQVLERACRQLASVTVEDETVEFAELLERAGHPAAATALRGEALPQDFSLSRFAPEVVECDAAAMRPWEETRLG